MAGGGSVDGKVDKERIGNAADALLRWVDGAKEQQRLRLLDEEQFLYLVISLRKISDNARINPHRIPIPHPLIEFEGGEEICLIINDLSRGMKRKEAKEKVIEEGLGISKVIGFSKLKKKYPTHEAKRKLCGSYDLFLADKRIADYLPKALGKVFYKKKKTPILIDLSRGQWKPQIENVRNSTYFYVSRGSCSVVKAAKVSQTREEIMENIVAVIERVARLVPKQWENILALHLKTMESLALPIYQSSPSFPIKIDVNFNRVSKSNSKRAKNIKVVKLSKVEEGKDEGDITKKTLTEDGAKASSLKKKKSLKRSVK